MMGPHEEDRLSALLDDELDDDAALVVTRHLSRCDRCMAELEAIRATRGALRGLPTVTPPARAIQEAAAAAASAATQADQSKLRQFVVVGAGFLAVMTVVFLLGDDDSAGTVRPPVDVYVVDHLGSTGDAALLTPVDLRGP